MIQYRKTKIQIETLPIRTSALIWFLTVLLLWLGCSRAFCPNLKLRVIRSAEFYGVGLAQTLIRPFAPEVNKLLTAHQRFNFISGKHSAQYKPLSVFMGQQLYWPHNTASQGVCTARIE